MDAEPRTAPEAKTAEELTLPLFRRWALLEVVAALVAGIAATMIAADELGLIHLDGAVTLALVGVLALEIALTFLFWILQRGRE